MITSLGEVLQISSFSCEKMGNGPDENEDAYAVHPDGISLAVSDGASGGYCSRVLADFVVSHYTDSPVQDLDPTAFCLWLGEPVSQWRATIPWPDLKWYQEEKARRGAFATLLGVSFFDHVLRPDVVCWEATAVGDSCLFLVGEEGVKLVFPLSSPSDFDDFPPLISSREDLNREAALLDSVNGRTWLTGCCGLLCAGEALLLATDALAQWLLASYFPQLQKFEELSLSVIESHALVAREEGTLKNDDVTGILIRLGSTMGGMES